MMDISHLSREVGRISEKRQGGQIPPELQELLNIVRRPEEQSIEDFLLGKEAQTSGTIRKVEQLLTAVLVDAAIESEVGKLNLTTTVARTLATDAIRNDKTVMEVALAVATQVGPFTKDILLEKVRDGLSQAVAERLKEETDYRAVEGIERIGSGAEIEVDLGLGYNWRTHGSDCFIGDVYLDRETAIVNTISALGVSPDHRRKIVDILMPVVVNEGGEYVLKRKGQQGNLTDLYRGQREEDKSYKLSDIVLPRKTEWGSPPVYSKEEFARFLEAVIHSEIPEGEKRAFAKGLLKTERFEENKYIPQYLGGRRMMIPEVVSGTRITLPTGQSLRLLEADGGTEYTLEATQHGYHYGTKRTDAIFVMALVENGSLPRAALGCIYDVRIQGNQLHLTSKYIVEQSCTIDLSKPFDKKIDFSPMLLSFLLERDPRVSHSDRARLKAFFASNIQPKVTAKQEA